MNPIRRPTFRSTFFISSAIVGILSLLQVIAAGGPSLFGKSVGGLAAGVMQYYPGIAVGEALKIHASVLLLVLIVVHYYRFAQRYLKFRGAAKALLFSSPLVGWALITLGSVTQYPALYESNLIARFSGLIFKSSYFLAPDLLRTLALLIALAPFIVVIAVRWRRRVLSGAGLSVAMCCLIFPLGGSAPSGAVPTIASQEAGDLDIILIGIDSLRSDRVGQGGPQGSNDRVAVMPTLTKLSQDMDSVSFEDHIVGIPRTFPSWIEILQGKYSAHTGIRHMFPGFSPRDSKFLGLTSRLKEAGYRTTVVSDFAGDIFPRFDAGFDEIVAPGMTLGNMIRQSVDLMFPLYLPLVTSYVGHSIFPALKTAAVYSDPSYLSDVSIKKMAANRSAYPGSPNFMTVFFSTAHFPYAAPYPYYRMFADKNYSGPFYFQKNPALNGDESGLSAEDKLQVAHLYDGSLRAVDDSLRVLLQRIRSTGRWDKTMIIVTADHGEEIFDDGNLQGHGEHLRGEHVLKVPLIVKLPKKTRNQSDSARAANFVTRSIDIAPTILGLAGLQSGGFEGRDLSPWISGSDSIFTDNNAYAETEIWFSRSGNGPYQKQRLDYPGISGLLTFDAGYSGEIILNPKFENIMISSRHRALITTEWKLIYIPGPNGIQWELYNRRIDPNNRVNVLNENSKIADAMQKQLLAQIQKLESNSRLVGGYVVPR